MEDSEKEKALRRSNMLSEQMPSRNRVIREQIRSSGSLGRRDRPGTHPKRQLLFFGGCKAPV